MSSIQLGNTRVEVNDRIVNAQQDGIALERKRILGLISLMQVETPDTTDIHTIEGRRAALVELRRRILTDE